MLLVIGDTFFKAQLHVDTLSKLSTLIRYQLSQNSGFPVKHVVIKKSIIYLLHAGLWICHLSLVVLVLGILFQGNEDSRQIALFWDVYFLFALLPSVLSFYVSYFILPRYVRQKRITASIVAALGIALTCTAATYVVLYVLGSETHSKSQDESIILSVTIIFFITIINIVLAIILKGFISWVDEIKLKEALMQRNHEMEIALVKSQLDPHFLFNTINNIDVLILKDPEVASLYLNKLSDILRFMLYETKPYTIPLKQEIVYMEKYAALQKLRTTNKNFVHISVNGKSDDRRIAPMTFLPFIENAFKHVLNKKTGVITIDLDIKERSLHFICKNTYDPGREPQEHNGLGNDLIRKRLELVYPKKHSLRIVKDNECYSSQLIIEA